MGRWLVGSTVGARSLRVSAALLLLAWGTVDQARHYLALRSDDLRDLQRAASLDGFDSSLQMRLAHREMEEGAPQLAEAAWRQAMQANPANPAARQGLLRLLIDQKRLDEAFDLTEASLQYTPNDANLLVDRGILALQRGRADLALASWDQALTVDPGQSLAHLYIAYELDREGKSQAAATHYNSFLEKIARQPAQNRPAPDKLIAVVLRMADCQALSSQTEPAMQSYHLAEKLAAQTGQAQLESVADVNEAELQAKSGKLDDALRLYQRALQVDESIGDNRATAQDWFAYGRFLDDAGFPARLAYACMVKSESVAQSIHPTAVPANLVTTRQRIERRLGAAAAVVRRDPEPVLREALALRR